MAAFMRIAVATANASAYEIGKPSFKSGSFKNMSVGVCYDLEREGFKAVKKILRQVEGSGPSCYIVHLSDVNLIHDQWFVRAFGLPEEGSNLLEPAFFV